MRTQLFGLIILTGLLSACGSEVMIPEGYPALDGNKFSAAWKEDGTDKTGTNASEGVIPVLAYDSATTDLKFFVETTDFLSSAEGISLSFDDLDTGTNTSGGLSAGLICGGPLDGSSKTCTGDTGSLTINGKEEMTIWGSFSATIPATAGDVAITEGTFSAVIDDDTEPTSI